MKIQKSIMFRTEDSYIEVYASNFDSGQSCVIIANDDQQFEIIFTVEEFEAFLELAREVLG